MRRLIVLLAALTLVAAACTDSGSSDTTAASAQETTTTAADSGGQTGGQTGGSLLATVQSRGTLKCGVNQSVPGFGFVDANGDFSGFDIDYCKAVAVAVLGDPTAVEYIPLTAQQRFTALQSGEIDVLIRNTTFTAKRDGAEGATFATTTFYDGQAMMVRADSGFETIEDMANVAVCALAGTTTEQNLAQRFGNIPYTPLTFEDNETLQNAFIAGQCDGWTSDRSQLFALRSAYPEADGGPEALVILEDIFSKEPLGPVTRDGDSQWAQVVDWVVLATIQAEEFGLTSSNIGSYSGDNNRIKQFVGQPVPDSEGNEALFDPGLGLSADYAVRVVEAVGNYAEIYARNIDPIGIPRGVNSLWTDGGLLYSPPYN